MAEAAVDLKPGREESVLRRHPWIFGGAIAHVRGNPASGDTVVVRSARGDFLARAAFSPQSQITARVWSWDENERIDADYFRIKIGRAIEARAGMAETTNAVRWVNAESDGLPGVVIDRYAEFAVGLFLSAGAEKWKREMVDALAAQPGLTGVYERSDVDVRAKEGLPESAGVLWGDAAPDRIEVWESAPRGAAAQDDRWRFGVDVIRGHKSGFYLDQRENRRVVFDLARDRSVLNAFAYTGGFSIAAWSGGATEVLSVDSSAPALEIARENLRLNGLPETGLIVADVFEQLRAWRDEGRKFDLIILDPPKFAHSKSQLQRATRAYKDINWLGLRLLTPGGYLVTFSCSGLVSEDLFQKILFGASLDARRDAQILRRLSQAADHPVSLSFPEGAYLKGFVLRAGA